ncbi:PREDICTED: histone deacetylase 6 isoform X1 [Dinoponera quadriceps]|uniref:Protein deacetylase HDAC6 n=2 Tax=Dinoponera quadriceps TaxID=609295 RepID=A0A6P3X7L8_DINQU|nr:PREDICTED: histone deacetylase 6 isoform X1 [Dinoponera quadriceps]
MDENIKKAGLFAAAKHLADSEVELIKVIGNSSKYQNQRTAGNMPANGKKMKKPGKSENVHPSPALLAAKREAAQRQLLLGKKLNNNFVRDIYQKATDAYETVRKDTGLVFDQSMTEHECLWDPDYAECPARFTRVLQRCEELGLVQRCKLIKARLATESEILMKHSQKHIDILKATDGCTDSENLELLSSKYDSIYVHPSTYKLSLLATGSTINLVESICKGKMQNGMAIVRPPGHHAMKSEYCGYCFFNNVALAAEKALSSNWASRILIVDWDVHHGQATQQMFYNDPRVVYFSIHRYEYGEFWPNLRESDFHNIGEDLGEGYNFNIPLNKTGMTNADYIAIFQQVLLPMAYEFQPDLVIVSAGYDAALGCPEGEMLVTPACYSHLLSSLLSLAAGKVAVVLEGGYCLKSLAEGAALTLRTLLGDPCPVLQTLELPSLSIRDTILNVIYAHRQYWNCYQYQDSHSINTVTHNKEEIANQHVVTVTYKGSPTKPEKYETRNCYPKLNKEIFEALDKKLNELIQFTNLYKAPHKVCIVYDERMLKHCNISDSSHPEMPTRISSIYRNHEEHGLLERCHLLHGRNATMEELSLVHSKDYIDRIKNTATMKRKELEEEAAGYISIYLHKETWPSACMSAGSLLQVVDVVLNGECQSGVAIVRPPGHHAEDDDAYGFCIFNNVAVAARYAIQFHHVKRVLIVDWDVHHGNGTQSIFEEDPRVLYISVHRYDNGSFFPNTKDGNYTSVGLDAGEGFNVNVPWNKRGMGDAEYIAAFQQVVMPIAYQFDPELVLISAGFDACVGDPLGGCHTSPELYGHLTHWLSSLANGRIILSLEGGYNINSISHAMTMCTKALLGDPLPMLEPGQVPCTSAINSINNVLKIHKKFWPNLQYDMSLPKERLLPKLKLTSKRESSKRDKRLEERGKNAEKPKQTESKIALEGIESEKLELCLSIDKNCLNLVTDEEILKLRNEVENIKIKNCEIDTIKGDSDETRRNVGSKKNEAKNPDVSQSIQKCVNETKQSRDNQQGSSSIHNDHDEEGAAALQRETRATNLLDYLSDHLQALTAGEMFAVVPLRDCPHLSAVNEVPPNGIDVTLPCTECTSTAENWICLQCYTVHCARNVNQHAMQHAEECEHPIALSFADISVWCYGCEAYIDNPRLYPARNAAHQSKFNEALPWTYNGSSTHAS